MKKIVLLSAILLCALQATDLPKDSYVKSWRPLQETSNRVLYDTTDQKNSALLYLNTLRNKAGLFSLQTNTYLDMAAQNHADYMMINNQVGHYESSSYSNYTGVYPSDRAVYAGYQSREVSENLSYGQIDTNESIDGLFSAIYHRLGFLDTKIDEIGIGINDIYYNYDMGNSGLNSMCEQTYSINGAYYTHVCADNDLEVPAETQDDILKNTALNNPSIILWPYQNATDIPPVFFEESPDPLPNQSVSGYPISVSFNPYYFTSAPTLDSFKLYDANGNEITDTLIMTKDSDPNGDFSEYDFALFPLKRLEWNAKYRAVFSYKDENGNLESINWEFITRALNYPTYTIDTQTDVTLNIIPGKSYAIYFVPQDANDNLDGYNYSYSSDMSIQTDYIDADTILINITGNIGSEATFNFSNGRVVTLKLSSNDSAISSKPLSFETDNEINTTQASDTAISLTASNIAQASSGWSLLGSLDDTNITDINSSTYKIIWEYKDGRWYAHSPIDELKNQLKNLSIEDINSLQKGNGFWLYK